MIMITDTLDRIKYYTGSFKDVEVQLILNNREKFEPHLLELLDGATKNHKPFLEEEREDLILALYILSHWRSKEAFDKYLKLASLSSKELDMIFGDVLTEGLCIFLYRTYNGDFEKLSSFIIDTSIDEYARGAALDALNFLTLDQPKFRDQLICFYEELLKLPQRESEVTFPAFVVSNLVDLGSQSSMSSIKDAFNRGIVDTQYISLKHVTADLNKGSEAAEKSLRNDLRSRDHEDVKKAMIWMSCYQPGDHLTDEDDSDDWDDFDDELQMPEIRIKIGRNDLCPCGSGKKYKKCCLM